MNQTEVDKIGPTWTEYKSLKKLSYKKKNNNNNKNSKRLMTWVLTKSIFR